MSAIAWLERNAHGFVDLSARERNLVMEFTLLWGLFEAEALQGTGNLANRLVRTVNLWSSAGLLHAGTFARAVEYFRHRYYGTEGLNHRFEHLHLERSGNPQVVVEVLVGRDLTPPSVASAVLIIVARFRNNLFHGEKWSYALKHQSENFIHANAALIEALELNRSLS